MKAMNKFLLLLLLAVRLSAFAQSAAPAFTTAPELTANPNPRVPLAAVLRFTANQPVHTLIHISDGKQHWTLNYDAAHKPEAGLPVVGMRPQRRHTIRVEIRDQRGRKSVAPQTLEFTTPPLPAEAGEFPPLRVTTRQTAKMEPGVTLLSLRRAFPGAANDARGAQFGLLLAVDAAGEVVWYYKTTVRISDFARRANGNILTLDLNFTLTEIDLLGNEVASWYASRRPRGQGGKTPVDVLTFHHEIDELPNGNFVVLGTEQRAIDNYYTSETDAQAPRKRQQVMGDEIIEFTRDGRVVWQWNAFDYLDPFQIGYETFNGYWERRGFPGVLDWTHANNILSDQRDDSLLVSLRHLSAILKIDRKTKEIRWILGEPSGWPQKLQAKLLKPVGKFSWFYMQHSPTPTPQGTLLIFDNSNYGTKPFTPPLPEAKTFSRALEYAIDEKRRTVRQLWQSETLDQDAVLSAAMGDVEWLPRQRNVLVTYGSARAVSDLAAGDSGPQAPGWTRIREYARTSPAQLVWELVLRDEAKTNPVTWQCFGSDRWPQLTRQLASRK